MRYTMASMAANDTPIGRERSPSLEIRINSLDDARSVVFHGGDIESARMALGLESVEFLVASEIKSEVNAVIRGVFRCRTFTSYVGVREGNKLYELKHFKLTPVVPNTKLNKLKQAKQRFETAA